MRASMYFTLALVCVVLWPSTSEASGTESPAIKNVIGMLDNLVATLDSEAKKDEETFTHFSAWCSTQIAETSSNIETLQAGIEETSAALSNLKAREQELTMSIASLKAQINQETNQLQMATEKRTEEHTSFLREQQDFDGAIQACGQAVKVLSAHYGDGGVQAAEKPAWMSFFGKDIETVRRVAKPYGKAEKLLELLQTRASSKARGGSLRQAPGATVNNGRYQDSSGEAGNVVEQIGELSETFDADKQSAVSDENRLQGLFNTLQAEKSALLAQLRGELASQTATLNDVNEQIADKEGKLMRLEGELKDDQAYLARTTKLKEDATDAYNTRQADRKAEQEAVGQAVGVLESFLKSSFMQEVAVLHRIAGSSKRDSSKWDSSKSWPMTMVYAARVGQVTLGRLADLQLSAPKSCPTCKAASALLRSRAVQYHSELLQAAATAAAGAGNEAIAEIVASLDKIVAQLKRDQRSEDDHKGWCDKELGITKNKITDHSGVIGHLTGVLANLQEVLAEEKIDRDENHDTEVDEDNNFVELTGIRGEEKVEFEHAHEESAEAINALNQAIGILAKFYASRKANAGAFIQDIVSTDPQKGGSVVNMISEVRHEFEVAKVNLEETEETAVKDYGDNRDLHMKVDNNIQQDENVIDTGLVSTEAGIDSNTENLGDEKAEKVQTVSYLDQLGRSCYQLIANYDDRKKRRVEEKKAVEDAQDVLREHA